MWVAFKKAGAPDSKGSSTAGASPAPQLAPGQGQASRASPWPHATPRLSRAAAQAVATPSGRGAGT